jgi:hypothetical protein
MVRLEKVSFQLQMHHSVFTHHVHVVGEMSGQHEVLSA